MEHTHDIGAAVVHIKQGGKAKRSRWNGKDMHIELMHHRDHAAPFIALKLPDGSYQPGWNASTPDLLADDWGLF